MLVACEKPLLVVRGTCIIFDVLLVERDESLMNADSTYSNGIDWVAQDGPPQTCK